MNLDAALTHAAAALNALPGHTPPDAVIELRVDAVRTLAAYADPDTGTLPLGLVAESLWAWGAPTPPR